MTLQHDFSNPAYCKALKNLFKPGSGVRPPLLGGRDNEQTLLGDYLDTAQGELDKQGRLKSEVPHDIVLYGPRGNGKTVLIDEFEQACEDKGAAVVTLTPDKIKTPQALAKRLLDPTTGHAVADKVPEGPVQEVAQKVAGKAKEIMGDMGKAPGQHGLQVTEIAAKTPFAAVSWAQMSPDELLSRLDELLLARCRGKENPPLVISLDEAHKLKPEVGNQLLNLSQTMRRKGGRFLLVLAGTPNLRGHLGKMDATFWDRSEIVALGRLDESSTRDALVAPLGGLSVSFDPDALARVVADSQHYPYFIQIWGKALCEVLVNTKQGKQITASVADEAWAAVEKRREQYYSGRYSEMEKLGLLDAAERVAGAFAGRDVLYKAQVIRALTEASGVDEAQALEQFDELSKIGYLWQAPQTRKKGAPPPPDIEPGIPSLMTYVSEVVQANRAAVREAPVQDNENQAEDRNDDGGGAPTGMGQGQT